jgi:D-cysteine desulfhydrase
MYPSNFLRTPLANIPTPLQLLERVSAQLGGPRIWVKRDDLTGSVLTGNKVRKLEFLLADAKAQNANLLITSGGVQSNHCRATALIAAQAGLKSHLILRGEEPASSDGNLLLDRLAGAAVSFHKPLEYQQRLPALFEYWEQEYREQGFRPYSIPTGGSNAVGLWGYLRAAEEMHEQFAERDIDPGHIICATGSGGTQAGLTLGFALLRPASSVLGFAVCDDAGYFEAKVKGDVTAWAERYEREALLPRFSVHTCDDYIGPGYGKAGKEVFETIAWLARTEGLVLDPVYTGKAFHGLANEIKRGRFAGEDDLVFVHTGGVFGVFPYRDEFDV